jgi:hypothetical protein
MTLPYLAVLPIDDHDLIGSRSIVTIGDLNELRVIYGIDKKSDLEMLYIMDFL